MTQKTELRTLVITTHLGAVYHFPDVDKGAFEWLPAARCTLSSVTLVNVSNAVLVLPTRIIDSVTVDGKEIWKR